MRIGFHVSIAGSVDEAVDRAVEMGINTFQMFTRNPRGWQFKPLDQKEVSLFKEKLGKVDVKPVFAHMPYLSNLASPRQEVYTLSVRSLATELKRCNELGVPFLITHLGSHVGSGKAAGLKRIVEAVNSVFADAEGQVMLLLENTAGTENSMGSSFEDIRKIIDGVSSSERVGICFDTCHAFAAGYDLGRSGVVENTLEILDSVLGLERLKVVHLNDSVGGLRSHLDRHEHIGLGKIGEEGFRAILNSEFGRCPMIMETPVDERRIDLENLTKIMDLAKK
ncbi:MAG: deoxyribonuclease IV [Candidatus Bathyarchaeota archaeon]